jgi:hypothetical protein
MVLVSCVLCLIESNYLHKSRVWILNKIFSLCFQEGPIETNIDNAVSNITIEKDRKIFVL